MDANAWAALGCAVANPAGTCVGSGCGAAGLVSVGAATFNGAAGFSTCVPSCPTGGAFVNAAGGTHTRATQFARLPICTH